MPEPCAYCAYHNRYITVRQLKTKDCLNGRNPKKMGKHCPHLRKIMTHRWWIQQEVIKKKRKERKLLR